MLHRLEMRTIFVPEIFSKLRDNVANKTMQIIDFDHFFCAGLENEAEGSRIGEIDGQDVFAIGWSFH